MHRQNSIRGSWGPDRLTGALAQVVAHTRTLSRREWLITSTPSVVSAAALFISLTFKCPPWIAGAIAITFGLMVTVVRLSTDALGDPARAPRPRSIEILVRMANEIARNSDIKPKALNVDEWILQTESDLADGDQIHSLTSDLTTIDGRETVQQTIAENLKRGAQYFWYMPALPASSEGERQSAQRLLSFARKIMPLVPDLTDDQLNEQIQLYVVRVPILLHFGYSVLSSGEWCYWYLLSPPPRGLQTGGQVVVHEFQGQIDEMRELFHSLRKATSSTRIELPQLAQGRA
jgi:hypothetical protein